MSGRLNKGLIFIVLLAAIPLSCEELNSWFVDCSQCFKDKISRTDITVKLTINDENPWAIFDVYRGNTDSGELLFTDTSVVAEYYWRAEINQFYSVKARYSCKGRVIYVVDGAMLKTKLESSACDEECYTIHGDVLDARLKY